MTPPETRRGPPARPSGGRPGRDLLRYLALLTGREPPGALLEIRYRTAAQQMRQRWHPATRPVAAATEIEDLARDTDVYVGVAPRRHRHGGRAAIHHAWVLWADVDDPAAQGLADRLPIAPGVIIASGSAGHRHLYWPLAQPLDIHAAEHANAVLAHAVHGDTGAVLNAATILRPPGTLNWKQQPPRPVTLERLAPRAHPAPAILAGLPPPAPDDPPATPESPAAGDARPRARDALLAIDPAVYVHALTGLTVPRDRKVPCPLHTDRTPSLHVYPTPAEGWHCYGCGRGGSVYDLAAAIWQLDTRGPDFLALRKRLQALLLPGRH